MSYLSVVIEVTNSYGVIGSRQLRKAKIANKISRWNKKKRDASYLSIVVIQSYGMYCKEMHTSLSSCLGLHYAHYKEHKMIQTVVECLISAFFTDYCYFLTLMLFDNLQTRAFLIFISLFFNCRQKTCNSRSFGRRSIWCLKEMTMCATSWRVGGEYRRSITSFWHLSKIKDHKGLTV